MMFGLITLGARQWLSWAIALLVASVFVLFFAYRAKYSSVWVRIGACLLKATGIVALATCLVEPLYTGTRPRPGNNLFLVIADNSRSLQLVDPGARKSRGAVAKDQLATNQTWLTRLGQDFDLRRYAFDTTLRPLNSFDELSFDGEASIMHGSLTGLVERFRGQPIAGILVLTDGNSTDPPGQLLTRSNLPPIYPVPLGTDQGLLDVSIANLTVSQTSFEAAPITMSAEVRGQGLSGKKVYAQVLDEAGKEVEKQLVGEVRERQPANIRFLIKPEKAGLLFYTLRVYLEGEEQFDKGAGDSAEATTENNRRLVAVNRGGGPYRVLYLGGRPNWEFKFLRRAIDDDDEVHLVALVRVAKKEPKFRFLGRGDERTNPLFRGFGNKDDEQAEQYDQPVLIRIGTENKEELAAGFPQNTDDMFRYHAVILDDIEAEFFKPDQLSLLQKFVSHRGGGLLMLGGQSSFADGKYQRTPIADMLPVYLDRTESAPPAEGFRLTLTREGWLQPWVRLRTNEGDEEKRLAEMPAFRTLNRVQSIKPGASVLASVEAADGKELPGLVVQQFGRGRTAALLIGDMWRWNMRRSDHTQSDLEKAWRQTLRWLVSDVPQPTDVECRRDPASKTGMQLVVQVRDREFAPLDNATVSVSILTPDQKTITLDAESSDTTAGQYVANFTPRIPGGYRASVVAKAADGTEVGTRTTGWTTEPQVEELKSLAVNRTSLQALADASGGEVIEPDNLDQFVNSLPNRKIPITETWTYPLWHQWSVFMVALASLIGEWGLRRWKGLA